jgi:hypothetical protein
MSTKEQSPTAPVKTPSPIPNPIPEKDKPHPTSDGSTREKPPTKQTPVKKPPVKK